MPAGRPPEFETAEEMNVQIEQYFETTKKPFTVSGLALFLGFCSRQSMYDNEGRNDQFSYVIKRARLRIERDLEANLDASPALTIFKLKNMGWTDKTEVDNTHSFNERPIINFTDNSKK